jgi:hypothetical protein
MAKIKMISQPQNKHNRRVMLADVDREEKPQREIIDSREGEDKKTKRQAVKREARINRSTTKWDRAAAKRVKSTFLFLEGDLVYEKNKPDVCYLVVDTDDTWSHDTIVDVMDGVEIRRFKAISLRRVEE